MGDGLDSFLPPFFGVLAAFGLNGLKEWYSGQKRKINYLKSIRIELDRAESNLNQAISNFDKFNLPDYYAQLANQPVYPDILSTPSWNSLISSGDLRLFPDEASTLGKVYSEIRNYNYRLRRTIDAENEFKLYYFTDGSRQASNYSGAATSKMFSEIMGLLDAGRTLRDDISSLKAMNFMAALTVSDIIIEKIRHLSDSGKGA